LLAGSEDVARDKVQGRLAIRRGGEGHVIARKRIGGGELAHGGRKIPGLILAAGLLVENVEATGPPLRLFAGMFAGDAVEHAPQPSFQEGTIRGRASAHPCRK